MKKEKDVKKLGTLYTTKHHKEIMTFVRKTTIADLDPSSMPTLP